MDKSKEGKFDRMHIGDIPKTPGTKGRYNTYNTEGTNFYWLEPDVEDDEIIGNRVPDAHVYPNSRNGKINRVVRDLRLAVGDRPVCIRSAEMDKVRMLTERTARQLKTEWWPFKERKKAYNEELTLRLAADMASAYRSCCTNCLKDGNCDFQRNNGTESLETPLKVAE
jgi:hypothetical protein